MAPTSIVTGAARGIGRAIALRLAKDGHKVCVNDIHANRDAVHDTVKDIHSQGGTAIPSLADVSKRSEVTSMVQQSVAELGPLNSMVANAGIAQVGPLVELSEQDWERMFTINVFGVNNCYVEAAKQMMTQGPPPKHPPSQHGLGGVPIRSSGVYKLLGATSITAFKPFPLLSHYSASKWAVRGLTQAMAMELAPHGITVNGYAPGIVGTKMWDLIDEGIGKLRGAKKGDILKKYSEEMIALGRTSVPEDVSSAVSFLAGPDSDYMTGQNVVCDGGIVYT